MALGLPDAVSCRVGRVPLVLAALCALAPALGPAAAAEQAADAADRDYAAELPRIAPLEPDAAAASFEILPGFQLELAAAEPLVEDPVAVSFDEDGRLYVVEMCGYSEQPDENRGIVRRLEDTDADGRFDRSTVFATEFSWPTAVICWDGGVFVGDAPDILFLKDTDGDGVADERRQVFTGFGKSNVQGLLNSFAWGLDNRIYGATSASGGQVRRADRPDDTPLSLNGRDFAFDPLTLEMAAVTGGAQHGLSFDDWGTRYVCHNSDHAQQIVLEDRYLARNPHLAASGARRSIAEDGPQAEVFRISQVEPWRIVRTRLRAKGIVPGVVEGGGRPAGYFTSGTGVTIYRGDAWPAEYVGQMIVGDVGSNVVHRKLVDRSGVVHVARRADPGREFLASRDTWFRPVQFANGPDGALYVLDMYREVIEHPLSIPPLIKKHLDLTSGRDRGRIYRVVPVGFQRPAAPRLSQAGTAALVQTLAHPNGWRRDAAARVLYARQDAAAAPALVRMLESGDSPLGRLHAFCVLSGLGALQKPQLLAALRDPHPGVRRHAVRLCEPLLPTSTQLADAVAALARDADEGVRFQAALTLGEATGPARLDGLVALASSQPNSEPLRTAALSSLREGAGVVLARLLDDRAFRGREGARGWFEQLLGQIAAAHQKDEVAAAAAALAQLQTDDTGMARELLVDFALRMARRGADWRQQLASAADGKLAPVLDRVLDETLTVAANGEQSVDARAQAARGLALGTWSQVGGTLAAMLSTQTPAAVQSAALATLSQFHEPAAAQAVLAAWSGFGPSSRRQATELLFARAERISALLDAVAAGALAPTDIEPARIAELLKSSDETVRGRAEKLFAAAKLARRQEVVDAYRPALTLAGDAARGRAVFKKTCAACHKLEGVGHELGPNLAAMQSRGAEAILLNVLDPNREVNPQYLNYAVQTEDGRTLTGMISGETAASVTLVRAEAATDTVLRVNIEEMRSTGLSIMPEGMEKELDQQTLADVIAYIMSLK